MTYKIVIECPGTPQAGYELAVLWRSALHTDLGNFTGAAGVPAFNAHWMGTSPAFFCYDGSAATWKQGVTKKEEPEVNNLDKYTPGTRPEVVKVTNSLEGQQQIANQIAASTDFGIFAGFALFFIIGLAMGIRAAASTAGAGNTV